LPTIINEVSKYHTICSVTSWSYLLIVWKSLDADIIQISNTNHAPYFLCVCLHLIKIIKDLDQSFKHKCLWTQQSVKLSIFFYNIKLLTFFYNFFDNFIYKPLISFIWQKLTRTYRIAMNSKILRWDH